MKKIIGLVGETGSGKNQFCQYLKKIFKPFFHFRFSDPLSDMLRILFNDIRKEDQQWLAIMLRQRFGDNILGKAITKKIRNIKKGLIVLDGIRYWKEYTTVKKLGGKIIYITADSKLRWKRIRNRGEKKDDFIPYKKFLELEKAKTEIVISQIGKKGDFKIQNNGSKKDFYQKIEVISKKL